MTFPLEENGKFHLMELNPEWDRSSWNYSVGDVALVLFIYKDDDIISFACCAIDNNPQGTVTLRSNVSDNKRSVQITFPVESIRGYTTLESQRQLCNKVARSFFPKNKLEFCYNM